MMDIPSAWREVPQESGNLSVSGGHLVWWGSFGSPDAIPVVVLHGGPGSGSNLATLDFFDPAMHRVIFIDQRGCGRSQPLGGVSENETMLLIADTEEVRRHLGIAQWIVFGGSWGGCLGLVYGQMHPTACLRLILRGLSHRHARQTDWVLTERPRTMPERYEAFVAHLDHQERADPVAANYRRILSDSPSDQEAAARAIISLEHGLAGPEPEPLPEAAGLAVDTAALARAKIFLHYWAHKSFLPGDDLVFDPHRLDGVPVDLFHGRSDWICPMAGSVAVAEDIAHAQLTIVDGAGHSPFHPALADALRAAVARET